MLVSTLSTVNESRMGKEVSLLAPKSAGVAMCWLAVVLCTGRSVSVASAARSLCLRSKAGLI